MLGMKGDERLEPIAYGLRNARAAVAPLPDGSVGAIEPPRKAALGPIEELKDLGEASRRHHRLTPRTNR